MDNYPDNLLKGVSTSNQILGESVDWTVFVPPSGDSVNGWKESSINWEDNQNALYSLFDKRKNGEVQFRGGIVRIPRAAVDNIIDIFKVKNSFCYERRELPDNPFHGNLLFAENLKSEIRHTICGSLSIYAKIVFDDR